MKWTCIALWNRRRHRHQKKSITFVILSSTDLDWSHPNEAQSNPSLYSPPSNLSSSISRSGTHVGHTRQEWTAGGWFYYCKKSQWWIKVHAKITSIAVSFRWTSWASSTRWEVHLADWIVGRRTRRGRRKYDHCWATDWNRELIHMLIWKCAGGHVNRHRDLYMLEHNDEIYRPIMVYSWQTRSRKMYRNIRFEVEGGFILVNYNIEWYIGNLNKKVALCKFGNLMTTSLNREFLVDHNSDILISNEFKNPTRTFEGKERNTSSTSFMTQNASFTFDKMQLCGNVQLYN